MVTVVTAMKVGTELGGVVVEEETTEAMPARKTIGEWLGKARTGGDKKNPAFFMRKANAGMVMSAGSPTNNLLLGAYG